jgi:tetratricopeptide (TPR) repeat protein
VRGLPRAIIAPEHVTSSDGKPPPSVPANASFDPTHDVAVHVEALLTALDKVSDASERAWILIEVATHFRDGLRDGSQALDALIEAWQADPTNTEILDHLEPLARAQSRWPEIFETTRALVTNETDPSRALAYAEAMVRWLTREVPMPELALHYLERVRILDSTHWLVHLFQAAKYEERGDVKGELEELDRAVLSAKRADDRARVHILMANRYGDERSANSTEAKRHFLAAHTLKPDSMEALSGLEQIYLRARDLPALADVLEKQVEVSETEEEQVRLLLRLAEIYEKQLLKPDLAADKLERAFAIDPTKEEALASLERCYTTMRRWDDLVRVLEGAVVLVDDPQERAERLIALAEIFESKLGDLAGAVSAYERLAGLLPDDETLVSELARLSEKMGNWEAAVRHRTKLAELAPDARARARMHVMAGQLLLPHDRESARVHFERAVTFDSSNASAWNALLSEARESGDMARVAAYLEERAASTEGPRAQAHVYAELGNVRHGLGDEGGALSAWESAVAADPNNESAARGLLGLYVTSERWRDAAALCELVLYAAERDGDTERLFVARRHACLIAVHTGRPERALAMALHTYQMRPEVADVRRSLVECAWTLRADPLVLDAIEAVGVIAVTPSYLEALAPDARAQLGDVLALTGDRDRAIAIFQGLLAEQPDNPAALRGLSGLLAARGESIGAWTLKRQLAETITVDEERFQMLLETADGFKTKANRSDMAAQVYEQARAIRPNDRPLLHKLLALYQTLEEWPRVFDVLRAIADSDEDAPRKAKVLMAMGQIAHAKQGDRMTAVRLYDEALDVDPMQHDAFERIVRILTELEDWQALEGTYKRMLGRVVASGDSGLQHALLRQLGIVYRDRLGDRDGAIAAFRAAVKLRPDDAEDEAMLRDLLAVSGHGGDAIALTLDRARRDPLDPGPYGPLYDLLAQLGYADRAWCIASIMAHVGVSHPHAAAFHRSIPPPSVEQIPGTLGGEGYRRLLHPDLDPTLTAIFEVMAAVAIEVRVAQLGFRERRAHPGPPLTQPELLIHDIMHASRVLGVTPPRLFSTKTPPAIGVAVTQPPSLLVHPEALPGFPRNLLVFWIGKRLAELTPPLLARALFRAVSELKDLVAAAARIVQDKSDKRDPADDLWRAHIRKDRHRELSAAVESALAAGALDVRRWSQLADLSSSRAGLVIAGDVESTRLALVREGQSPGDLSLRDQMRELVAFFLSEEYAQIRAMLGVVLRQ